MMEGTDAHLDAPLIARAKAVKPSRAVHLPLIASLPATRDAPVSRVLAEQSLPGPLAINAFTRMPRHRVAGRSRLPDCAAAVRNRWAEQPERASLADRIRETAAELAANLQPAASPGGHRSRPVSRAAT